jgi:phosphatidylglycerophosphate synthase
VSLYSRFVNRPFGRVLAAAAARLGLSPNAVTAVSAVVTTSALLVLVLCPAEWAIGVVVALLLVIGFALDSADGQVARLTGRGSPAGEWLDHVVDSGKMVALHAAVLIAAATRSLLLGGWLLLPLAFLFVAVVFFSGLTLFELIRRTTDGPVAARRPSILRAVALLPADYGILCVVFAFWGAPVVFFVLYGMLLLCTALIGGALMVKWFRQLAGV